MTGNSEVENALRDLLEDLDKRLAPLRDKKEITTWQASMQATPESFSVVKEAELTYRSALHDRELFDQLTKYLEDPGVQDHQLRRWAQRIRYEIAPNLIPVENLELILEKEKAIQAEVKAFRAELDGETVTMNQINEILRSSDDVDLRRRAWEASKEVGPPLVERMVELAKMRNVAARSIGFPDYYRMNLELQELDEAHLFSALGTFTYRSEDAFRRMKATLDRMLADKFNIDAIDLAPWHYADPFFQEVPPIFKHNADDIFQGREVLNWVADYFKGIGLPLEKLLETGDFFDRAEKDPNSLCLNLDRKQDIRVLLNLKDNSHWAGMALHEFGKALYHKHISTDLPHSLRIPAHPSTGEAVALFFHRLAMNMEWLIEMFGLPGAQIRDLEQPLQELERMQMAISGRWIMVMIHFERGFYRDPDQDQHNRWWDLVERFQLLRRPDGRKGADWLAKPDVTLNPAYYHNYMLGQWQASMLREAASRDLELSTGASWVGDERIGEWFREKIFKHGGLWQMNELLNTVTGSVPRPNDFIDQYFTGW